ncbi:MAG: serine acetyltransferase [Deltaproteobacteria bacterium]|nr:serine acetyltransferase [Deltaproteobacteria bacterium]
MSLWSDIKKDYVRHGSSARNFAFWAVANYRYGRWASELPAPLRAPAGKVYGLGLMLVEITSGILLNRETTIGEDFHLVHSGNTKIHPRSVIGDRVGIMQDVTLGTTVERNGAPIIGNDVFIGAGAKILGNVRIGDRARIAANSLVITDVPPDTTAIGVPARIMRYTGRKAEDSSADGLATHKLES